MWTPYVKGSDPTLQTYFTFANGHILYYIYVNLVLRFKVIMKTLSLKIPDSLLTRINYTARERGESRSAIIREAIESFFSNTFSKYSGT